MYIHIYGHIYICMCMHTYIHAYICAYIYTHTFPFVYIYTHYRCHTKPVAVSFQTFSVLQAPSSSSSTWRQVLFVCLQELVWSGMCMFARVFLQAKSCTLARAGFLPLCFDSGLKSSSISSCSDPEPSLSSACRPQSYGRCCCGTRGGEQRLLGVHS